MLVSNNMGERQNSRKASERLKLIMQREKYLLNLPHRNKCSSEVMQAAASFFATLTYLDKGEPVDTSASDESTSSAPSKTTSTRKRRSADREREREIASKPAKKPRRGGQLIPPKTLVACLTESKPNQFDWVLGRISRYVPETKQYEVLDEADDGEVYRQVKKNIRIIPKKAQQFEPNQRVLAVYPATTVFYAASVVRKSGKSFFVEFDDEEANSTRIKEVDGRYVMGE